MDNSAVRVELGGSVAGIVGKLLVFYRSWRDINACEYGALPVLLAAPLLWFKFRDPWLLRGPLALLVWVARMEGLGWIAMGGLVVVAVLLAYEHALVRPDDLTRVNVAFFQVNVVISLGLLTVAVIDLLV